MKKLLTFVLLFCIGLPVFATHIKGGEIYISPVAGKPLTYDFTVTIYSEINRANTDQKEVILCFGNGESKIVPRVNGNGNGEDIGNNVSKNVYKISYTYTGNAVSYVVSASIANRSPNIRNLGNSAISDQIPFYIETSFNTTIINTTPVLTNSVGIIKAKTNQKFTYNAKAIDAEGDSLTYRLGVVRRGNQDNCIGSGTVVASFQQPNDINKVGTFKMDAKMGDLVWTAPTEIGTFVCAFVVEEWRKGVKISETVRDMEIQVVDGDGTVTPIPPYEPAGTLLTPNVVLTNENLFDEKDLVVYPNPTNTKIIVQISTNSPSKATFQLLDITGKLIQNYSQEDSKTIHIQEFDLQNLASGTLILLVEAGNKVYTRKVMKN